MDFHEIKGDKRIAERDIKNRKWESQYDYNWRLLLECVSEAPSHKIDGLRDITELPAHIRYGISDYREECDEVFRRELSLEKLEEIWGVV